jgi:hypothetical protein
MILTDEPAGNLDSNTGEEITGPFVKLQQEGRTILWSPMTTISPLTPSGRSACSTAASFD